MLSSAYNPHGVFSAVQCFICVTQWSFDMLDYPECAYGMSIKFSIHLKKHAHIFSMQMHYSGNKILLVPNIVSSKL